MIALASLLAVGAAEFWGGSLVGYRWQIRRDPPPPRLTAPLPTMTDLLDTGPEHAVKWTGEPRIAHYDPWAGHIVLSRQWTSTWDVVSAHVVAHERCHADQPRWPVRLAGLHMVWAVLWGVGAGWGQMVFPGAFASGVVAQWILDGVFRRRLEYDADQGAVMRVTQGMADPDRAAVIRWGRQLARNHQRALMIDGVGWSGLTLIVAVVTYQIGLWVR